MELHVKLNRAFLPFLCCGSLWQFGKNVHKRYNKRHKTTKEFNYTEIQLYRFPMEFHPFYTVTPWDSQSPH